MSVVSLRSIREPAPRLLEFYCVQVYWNDRGKLAAGRLQQFANMEAALRAGAQAATRWPAARVFRVRGNPEVDYWERTVTVAKYGERAPDVPAATS